MTSWRSPRSTVIPSPSRTMPSTGNAGLKLTARVATARAAAAAANSGVALVRRRQLTGVPLRRSSDSRSDQGQRTGTKAAGLGTAAAHTIGNRDSITAIRRRIRIEYQSHEKRVRVWLL